MKKILILVSCLFFIHSVHAKQDRFAQTIAKLIGVTYKAGHPISPEIKSVIKK